MCHGDAAVGHHDYQIAQGQFEARVSAHAQNDDLSVEVPSFEHIFDRDEPLHLFIFARHARVCTEPIFLWRLVSRAKNKPPSQGRFILLGSPDRV